MNITSLFNTTLEVGGFITATSTNFTGSDYLSLVMFLGFLLLIALLFRMPELLILVILFPVLIVFGLADPTFQTITIMAIIALATMLMRLIIFWR